MPQRGEVHRLVELALRDGTVAEEAGGHPATALQVVREAESHGERQAAGHDGVATVEAGGGVEQVHRAPAPAAATLELALELRHRRAHRESPGERMAVLPVGGDHGVIGREGLHHADGARLLADAEVEEAADRRLAVELDAALLEATDPQHLAQQVEGVVLLGRASLRRVALADRRSRSPRHCCASSVEVSPSGMPSSRALSSRRMILPLWVWGRCWSKAISRGATAAPSRRREKPSRSRRRSSLGS